MTTVKSFKELAAQLKTASKINDCNPCVYHKVELNQMPCSECKVCNKGKSDTYFKPNRAFKITDMKNDSKGNTTIKAVEEYEFKDTRHGYTVKLNSQDIKDIQLLKSIGWKVFTGEAIYKSIRTRCITISRNIANDGDKPLWQSSNVLKKGFKYSSITGKDESNLILQLSEGELEITDLICKLKVSSDNKSDDLLNFVVNMKQHFLSLPIEA